MDKLVISGGHKLLGEVLISGAKNSSLPLMFAALLTKDTVSLNRVPDLADISTTTKLLKNLGCRVENDATGSTHITADSLTSLEAQYDLVRTMRASVLVLGPILARFGEALVSLPGGCSIGARPVDLHLKALEQMGAKIELSGGYIRATCPKLHGAEIVFSQVSVGATENTIMAACLADGVTTIRNAAKEPEIIDLVHLLRKMGAEISGEGSSTIVIKGQQSLHGAQHDVIGDRIEAGTYLCAGAITQGDITVQGIEPEYLSALLVALEAAGATITRLPNAVRLQMTKQPNPVDVKTMPFPGFPTDMQAQFMAVMTLSTGTSVITENIFENRFMHVAELLRLGADIKIQGPTAIVRGLHSSQNLTGATVMATDLRASACLVLAGLAAQGQTTVRRIYHLDRGYESMEKKLAGLGALIERQHEAS